MASSGLLANFILGVKFLTRKLKFLESYKRFFFFFAFESGFSTHKITYFPLINSYGEA